MVKAQESRPKKEGVIPTKNGKVWGNKEYFECGYLHSSELATFAEFPDNLSTPLIYKYEFAFGHAFEDMVQDRATGSDLFGQGYFLTDVKLNGLIASSPMYMLFEWLDKGVDLEQQYKLNKDGKKSKKAVALHTILDECLANKGKLPINSFDYKTLMKMLDNFWKLSVKINSNSFDIADLLPKTKDQYQVPIIWQSANGVDKCALVDFINFIPINGSLWEVAFDIKTYANEFALNKFVTSKYWIQERHYIEGMQSIPAFKNVYPMMVFLTSMKSAPHYSMSFDIDAATMEEREMLYDSYCPKYVKYIESGCPVIGTKTHKTFKVYPSKFGQFEIKDDSTF